MILTVADSVEVGRLFANRWTPVLPTDTDIVVVSRTCEWATPSPANILCVAVPFSNSLSVKYRTMSALLHRYRMVIFIDATAVPLQRDSATNMMEAVNNCAHTSIVAIPSYYSMDQLYPWCMAVCNSSSNHLLVDAMADWVTTNPSPVEAQGLATLLGYHSSHTFIASYSDGIQTSFLRLDGSNTSSSTLVILNSRTDFVSTDGWVGDAPVVFYPGNAGTVDSGQFRKTPQSLPLLQVHRMHITAINYADGCCWQSQSLNSKTALQFGADSVFSYNRSSLDPEFVNRNSHILSRPKGAGYWLWKPWIILNALLHESVPWHDGFVLYLDSGNHYVRDIRSLVEDALSHSDISAPALTCCIESDWTKRDALIALDADTPEITDRPQIAAYFILVRKTELSVAFIKQWLVACENEHLIGDAPSTASNYPMFHHHVNDQSVLSILFRKYGFESIALEQATDHIKLARWRE